MPTTYPANSVHPVFIDLSRQVESFSDSVIVSAHAKAGHLQILGDQSFIYIPPGHMHEPDTITCLARRSSGETFRINLVTAVEDQEAFRTACCPEEDICEIAC